MSDRGSAVMVNVIRSWPRVEAGELHADESVLQDWGQLTSDTELDDIELVLGVYQDRVVAVYELEADPGGWERLPNGRVRFHGVQTGRYDHLIGTPNPGWTFGRPGVARSVQVVPLGLFTGHAPVETPEPGVQRAAVAGFVLEVVGGEGTLTLPPSGTVRVRAA